MPLNFESCDLSKYHFQLSKKKDGYALNHSSTLLKVKTKELWSVESTHKGAWLSKHIYPGVPKYFVPVSRLTSSCFVNVSIKMLAFFSARWSFDTCLQTTPSLPLIKKTMITFRKKKKHTYTNVLENLIFFSFKLFIHLNPDQSPTLRRGGLYWLTNLPCHIKNFPNSSCTEMQYNNYDLLSLSKNLYTIILSISFLENDK